MREITDSIMRMKIINHIKSLLSDSDDYVKEKAQNGLKYLKLNSEHSDNLIHGDAIISIFLLIQAGSSTTKESDPHPHYESIQACNGIKKIFALFQKNVSKYSRDRAAFCIGFLFKAREITDPVMRQEIINHLKSLLNDLNDLAKERAKNALKYLAQNAVNRCDILNETELIKIEQDLKLSFEGTEEQKKDILKKQETDLLLIQVILKGRNDDELRKWILSTGIIESLLFIFSNRDLISITQTYSSAFFQLTNNLSDEVKLLIYNKKPYPGLIRLLEHTDNLISGDAIISIFLILWAGANTTKKSDTNPHPHYESIQACDGLKKIIALFQKNVSKYSRDRSAFCIGFLFKAREITDPMMRQEIINHLKSLLNDQNDLAKERAKNALKYLALNAVNRSEIMQNFDLKTMAKNLLKELKVSEQEKQEIIKTQEFDCQLLYSLLFKIEDFQLRIEAINAGIIDALLHIFASRDLDYISKPYVVGFFIFTHPYSIPFSQLLIGKSPFPSLLRLLDHKDEQVVCEILASIDNIIYAGAIGTELTSQHPYYTGLASAGGIEKIYSVFKKTTDQYNIVPSAICLGIVLRAQEIKDSTMRKEIIEQLKSTVDDPDEETRNESRLSLKCLSQNQVNKTDIESNGFIIPE
ncbi:MAG: hypothetical protein EZS28_022080 [Streblomastix strix]|uniref:UNC-45/Cro1/She4 central domain-containing protein n=1 Tax=Streblomastix strix TaxID=222440 RepID=A0A5J4VIZ2_9EUKA|nr:MAG: hypothetical protein EZS28_022080 [Streblomastix strix]